MAEKIKSRPKFRFPEFLLAILVLLSGIMLGFSSGGFIINLKKVGFTVVSGIEKGVYSVGSSIKGIVTSAYDAKNLKKEYKSLTKKLQDYEYFQRNNVEIRKENDRLKEQLGFAKSLSQKNHVAQIIGRDPDSLYSGITINKGSRHGIRKGMPVIAIQNGSVGVVGKIVTVGAGTSILMPVYDTQCNISSRVQNTRDLGLVNGNGNQDGVLSMKYIKKRVLNELNYGDIIVTSGENDNYMRDIPVGTISKITVLDYDSSLDIELTPVIDFSRLETVLVVELFEENEKALEE